MAWYRANGGGGTDTSDATLNSGNQLLKDVTAYANEVKYTGTIESQTATTVTPKITSQPAGVTGKYMSGDVTVNPIYEEISTSAGMDAVNIDANLGNMYKYVGTTDTKYTNGSLYIVQYPNPVGGRIFYDNGDNGAIYTFYDSNYSRISDTSISGLANAAYYIVSGTPSKDRWYVFDNTTHSVSDGTTTYSANNGLVSNVRWGYYGITTSATTDSIGSGKTNTAKVLAIADTSSYNTNNIWKYVKALNDNSFSSHNDWFIGSGAEQEKLRVSGLVSYYNNNVLSSVEASFGNGCYAQLWYGYWTNDGKHLLGRCCFGMRAF